MQDPISFEWNEEKNESNKRKHGVSFEEAATVFYDENARVIFDGEHSIDEDRFVILGLSRLLRFLVVCHCFRKNGGIIRIISARKANTAEIEQYKNQRRKS